MLRFQVVLRSAAEEESTMNGQRLQQALLIADRFGLSRWELQMRYAEVLLLDGRAVAQVQEFNAPAILLYIPHSIACFPGAVMGYLFIPLEQHQDLRN